MSRGVTVTILAGLLLTACVTTGGCRRSGRDHTWYDANGNRIEPNWTTSADGKKTPNPHPYDRYGHKWVYDASGELVPPAPPASARSGIGGLFLWGGSGYRSFGSSSVSRGGFGSSGSSGG